jgi:hypothetical protein
LSVSSPSFYPHLAYITESQREAGPIEIRQQSDAESVARADEVANWAAVTSRRARGRGRGSTPALTASAAK